MWNCSLTHLGNGLLSMPVEMISITLINVGKATLTAGTTCLWVENPE